MLMQWLEPMITKRVQQVSEENNEDKRISDYVDKFTNLMDQIKPLVSEEIYLNVVMDMESIMNVVTFLSEDGAYRKGLMDGVALQQDMQKIMNMNENEKKPSVSWQATERLRTTG